MGCMQLGVLPQRRSHTCDLPGQDGLPEVAADGSALWTAPRMSSRRLPRRRVRVPMRKFFSMLAVKVWPAVCVVVISGSPPVFSLPSLRTLFAFGVRVNCSRGGFSVNL